MGINAKILEYNVKITKSKNTKKKKQLAYILL